MTQTKRHDNRPSKPKPTPQPYRRDCTIGRFNMKDCISRVRIIDSSSEVVRWIMKYAQ